jgi:uncharacterized CHY-type Zn-finger protein
MENSKRKQIKVFGKTIDHQTRCIHYQSRKDIIAIKFKCCNRYYPCYQCHNLAEHHAPVTWEKKHFSEKAILCGCCKQEITITEYLNGDNTCPNCNSSFNPKCSLHYHLYFDR